MVYLLISSSSSASWSEDGQHVAYVSENRQLSITTSTFAKTFDIKLPAYLSDEDVDSDLTGTLLCLALESIEAHC